MDENSAIYTETAKFDSPENTREHSHKPILVGHRLFRWTMLRIRLNNTMNKDLLEKLKTHNEIKSCLKSDQNNITLNFLGDPGIENAGAAMQRKFGNENGLLLNNFYFLFGLPRVVKIVGNAYKDFESELKQTNKEEGILETKYLQEESAKFEQERKTEEIRELGKSHRNEKSDHFLGRSQKKGEFDYYGASQRKDDYGDLNVSRRRDHDDLEISRSRKEVRKDASGNLGISHRKNDYTDRDIIRRQKDGFDDFRASGRYHEYEEPDDNRRRRKVDDEGLGLSRRKDDYGETGFHRRNEEFGELGRSKRKEQIDETRRRNDDFDESGGDRWRYKDSRLSKESEGYERVINRRDGREGEIQRREGSRVGHRREFESGVEDALWQLDKTLNEHD